MSSPTTDKKKEPEATPTTATPAKPNAWAQGAPKIGAGQPAMPGLATAPKPAAAKPGKPANPFRGTSMSDEDSLKYHHQRHGSAVSEAQYCADAAAFAANPTGKAQPTTLKDGSKGTKYRTPGGPGGIIDANGRVITYWYGDD